MVLDRDTQPPNQTASVQGQPSSSPMPAAAPMVSRIWMEAPSNATFWTGRSSFSENSMPRAKSSRATPISASSSMSWDRR